MRTVHLDFGDSGSSEWYFAYIPFGNYNLDIGNFYFVIQSNWKSEIWEFVLGHTIPSVIRIWKFVLLYFCTFAYISFGNCNLDIWNFLLRDTVQLEVGNRKFGSLYFELTYNPFGYSNLEIGNFGLLYFCTLVLLRTVPLEIRFSEFGGFGIVLSVQSEPNQYTHVDVAGGIDCYRLGYTNRT